MKFTGYRTSIVKPLIPTQPQILTCSACDRIVNPMHVRTVMFYDEKSPGACRDAAQVLKNALSEVLVKFYPHAGRVRRKEGAPNLLEIDCNDAGVVFIEASVDLSITDLGGFQPGNPLLDRLSPTPDYSLPFDERPVQYVQVTAFKCGGFSVGLAMHHTVSDATGAYHFVFSWGEVARGIPVSTKPVFDYSLLGAAGTPVPNSNPPELTLRPKSTQMPGTPAPGAVTQKVFTFMPDQLKRVKEEANRAFLDANGNDSIPQSPVGFFLNPDRKITTSTPNSPTSPTSCLRFSDGDRKTTRNPSPLGDQKMTTTTSTNIENGKMAGTISNTEIEDRKTATAETIPSHFKDRKIAQNIQTPLKDGKMSSVPFTTFESISAHTWRCVNRAKGIEANEMVKFFTSLDVRKRVQPNLPEGYAGNAIMFTSASATAAEISTRPLSFATSLVREAIGKMTNSYIRKLISWADNQTEDVAIDMKPSGKDFFSVSWFRTPASQTDFGFGTPLFVGSVGQPSNPAMVPVIMLPGHHKDAGSVNMLINLDAVQMKKLEDDPTFLCINSSFEQK